MIASVCMLLFLSSKTTSADWYITKPCIFLQKKKTKHTTLGRKLCLDNVLLWTQFGQEADYSKILGFPTSIATRNSFLGIWAQTSGREWFDNWSRFWRTAIGLCRLSSEEKTKEVEACKKAVPWTQRWNIEEGLFGLFPFPQ